MKKITLEYRDYNITDEVYEQVKALIESGKVCQECGKTYTHDNPEVARNLCMETVLKNNEDFKYLDSMTITDGVSKSSIVYRFISITDNPHSRNKKGYIAKSSKECADGKLEVSNEETLKYYGFTFPLEHEGKSLHRDWFIYGDVVNSKVVALKTNYYDWKVSTNELTVIYVSVKGQGYKELNKRKGSWQKAYKEAKAEVLKDENVSSYWVDIKSFELAVSKLPSDLSEL